MEMRTFLWTGYVTVPGAWQVALLQPGDCVVGRGAHPAT